MLAGEHYMRSFTRVYGLETGGASLLQCFLDHTRIQPLITPECWRFSVTSFLAGDPVTIYGDGGQSRDFTYIDNVVEGNLLAAAAPAEKGFRADDELGEQDQTLR